MMADTLTWQVISGMPASLASITLTDYDITGINFGTADAETAFTAFGPNLNAIRGSWSPREAMINFDIHKTSTADLVDEVRKLYRMSSYEKTRLVWTPTSSEAVTLEVLEAIVDVPISSDYNLCTVHVNITFTLQPFGTLAEVTQGIRNLVQQGNFDRPNIVRDNSGTAESSKPAWNFMNYDGTYGWQTTDSIVLGSSTLVYSALGDTADFTLGATSATKYTIVSDFRLTTFSGGGGTNAYFVLKGRKSAGATGFVQAYITARDGSIVAGGASVDAATLGTSDAEITFDFDWTPIAGYSYALVVVSVLTAGNVYLRKGANATDNMRYCAKLIDPLAWTADADTLYLKIYTGTVAMPGTRVRDNVHWDLAHDAISRWSMYTNTTIANLSSDGMMQVIETALPNVSYWMGFSYCADPDVSCDMTKLRMRVTWKTSGGTTIRTDTYNATLTSAGWHRFQGMLVTSPATTAQAQVNMQFYNDSGASATFAGYVNEVMLLEYATATPTVFIENATRLPGKFVIAPVAANSDVDVGTYLHFTQLGETNTAGIHCIHIAQAPITSYTTNLQPYYSATAARTYCPKYMTVNAPPPLEYRSAFINQAYGNDFVIFHGDQIPDYPCIALGWKMGGKPTAGIDYRAIPPVYGTYKVFVRMQVNENWAISDAQCNARIRVATDICDPYAGAYVIQSTHTISQGPWSSLTFSNELPALYQENSWHLVDLGSIYIPPPVGEYDTIASNTEYYLYLDMQSTGTINEYAHWVRIDSIVLLPTSNYLKVLTSEDPFRKILIPLGASTYDYSIDTRIDLRGELENSAGYKDDWKPFMQGSQLVIRDVPMLLFIMYEGFDGSNPGSLRYDKPLLILDQIKYNPALRGFGGV